jgi:hypothetical protein
MSARPEWWEVTSREDLEAEARNLCRIADLVEAELSRARHPAVRTTIVDRAERIRDLAAEAWLAMDEGDYWERMDALGLALRRREAALLTYEKTSALVDLFNSDPESPGRPRPILRRL